MLEFSNHAYRTARKEHMCSLCGRKIEVSEKYSRHSGVYDGKFFDHKHHLLCEKAIEIYCEDVCDNEYDNDSVIDWLNERVCYECEHGWHDDGKDDCVTSIFECKRVVERIMEVGDDG